MKTKTFYSPTCIDESRSYPDKKGNSRKTGKLNAFVCTRTFTKTENSKKVTVKRGLISISWNEDTEDSKAIAFKKALKGLEELAWLEDNRPLAEIPAEVVKLFTPNLQL